MRPLLIVCRLAAATSLWVFARHESSLIYFRMSEIEVPEGWTGTSIREAEDLFIGSAGKSYKLFQREGQLMGPVIPVDFCPFDYDQTTGQAGWHVRSYDLISRMSQEHLHVLGGLLSERRRGLSKAGFKFVRNVEELQCLLQLCSSSDAGERLGWFIPYIEADLMEALTRRQRRQIESMLLVGERKSLHSFQVSREAFAKIQEDLKLNDRDNDDSSSPITSISMSTDGSWQGSTSSAEVHYYNDIGQECSRRPAAQDNVTVVDLGLRKSLVRRLRANQENIKRKSRDRRFQRLQQQGYMNFYQQLIGLLD